MKLLAKWYRFPPKDRTLLLRTIPLLIAFRLGLVLLSFENLVRFLNWIARTYPARRNAHQQSLEKKIWAIEIVAKHLLSDGPCLTQALAAQFVLVRHGRPGELCIGVAKDEQGQLIAHAWIESDGKVVIGKPEGTLEHYSRLPSLKGRIY